MHWLLLLLATFQGWAIDPPAIVITELDVQAAEEVAPPAKVSKDYYVFFTSSSCPPCHRMVDVVKPQLEKAGYGVVVVDVNAEPQWGITGGVPEIWRVNSKHKMEMWKGYTNASELLRTAGTPSVVDAPVVKPQVRRSPVRQPLPTVRTNWGIINLETYRKDYCHCPMCVGIRALQKEYRDQPQYQPQYQTMNYVPPHQEPTPAAVLASMVDLIQLSETDVLADPGCGDARILIAATQKYGCTGIGVEIDPVKAEEARQRVREAGLSQDITIITGDALDFKPEDHGVTAITVYLYPDLLEKLSAKFHSAHTVASPYHKIPGLQMTQYGDVWMYKRKQQSQWVIDTAA